MNCHHFVFNPNIKINTDNIAAVCLCFFFQADLAQTFSLQAVRVRATSALNDILMICSLIFLVLISPFLL